VIRNRLIELRERRAQLVEHARAEREQLAALVSRTEAQLSWIDAAHTLLDEARRHPLIVVAGAALLIAIRPRRALKLLAAGWSLWQLFQRLLRWVLVFAPLVERAAGRRP